MYEGQSQTEDYQLGDLQSYLLPNSTSLKFVLFHRESSIDTVRVLQNDNFQVQAV